MSTPAPTWSDGSLRPEVIHCTRCGNLIDPHREKLTWHQREPGPICPTCADLCEAQDMSNPQIVKLMKENSDLRKANQRARELIMTLRNYTSIVADHDAEIVIRRAAQTAIKLADFYLGDRP